MTNGCAAQLITVKDKLTSYHSVLAGQRNNPNDVYTLQYYCHGSNLLCNIETRRINNSPASCVYASYNVSNPKVRQA